MNSSTIYNQLGLTLFLAISHFSPPNAPAISCIL